MDCVGARHYSAEATLRDGGSVRIRAIRAAYEECVSADGQPPTDELRAKFAELDAMLERK